MVLDGKVVQTVQISWSAILMFLNSPAKQNERRVATDLQNTGKENRLAQRRNRNFHGLVADSTDRITRNFHLTVL